MSEQEQRRWREWQENVQVFIETLSPDQMANTMIAFVQLLTEEQKNAFVPIGRMVIEASHADFRESLSKAFDRVLLEKRL